MKKYSLIITKQDFIFDSSTIIWSYYYHLPAKIKLSMYLDYNARIVENLSDDDRLVLLLQDAHIADITPIVNKHETEGAPVLNCKLELWFLIYRTEQY